MTTLRQLHDALDSCLKGMDFKSRELPNLEVPCRGAWTLKTWLCNRGVVLVESDTAVQTAQDIKLSVGEQLGRVPFFYGMGLQVVVAGALPPEETLGSAVDAIDNQLSIVQSVFVVDLEQGAYVSHRTWGQVVTGKYQDAIDLAIGELLRA